METILKIRRLYHKDGLSQRKIAEKLRLSRRTVKKYLNTIEMPQYQRQHTDAPKLGPYKALLIERLQVHIFDCATLALIMFVLILGRP
ncbi:HTH domain-containing protein [Pasteurellaceae bacterium HPA106]|uniref:HTH domain-containing protein n=1 Tax=Spirabiliibacterium pneumoniae TaxID=221400 RepID=UPI001AAD3BFB|nr:HTH domain-containing protein [Spirabiliibacterium pneumoniae]MBE2896947.1 HTH domain-containing protein [Spirabiliibacterium pneumoniae]